jgi:CDP-glycerol glycerophosphotransferase (TagB/SpsB family)
VEYLINEDDAKKTANVREDLNVFLDSIEKAVEDESLEALEASKRLRQDLENHGDPRGKKSLKKSLIKFMNTVKAIPVQYKVVFLPYYENTWDSLESVYEAFVKDPMFVTEIVIVPVKRNTTAGFKHVYNDYLTPKGIPNTHYDSYNFESDQPDFVFYNNPYDGVNYEKFASHVVKRNAGCMVYVPYYLYCQFHLDESRIKKHVETVSELPGHNNADIIVAQCDSFYETLGKKSRNADKMVVLGNPKVDYIIKRKDNNDWVRYPQWEKIIKGKTVFMLNTHYSLLGIDRYNTDIDHIFNTVIEHTDTALIWRPHPQSFLMLSGIEKQGREDFNRWLKLPEMCERIIIDQTENVMSAFMYSDALFTQFSSIMTQWLVANDGPLFRLDYDTRPDNTMDENNLDLYDCVYHYINEEINENERYRWDSMSNALKKEQLNVFFDDVKNNINKYHALREKYKKQVFGETDSGCGERIVEYIKKSPWVQ